MKKAILIDGHHLLSRTYHVPSFQNMKTTIDDKTVYVGATYGFLLSLKKMVELHKRHENDILIVVWDGGRGFRVKLDPQYKANRTKRTPEFLAQINLTRQFLRCMGVIQCQMPDAEADDAIGALTRRARSTGYQVLIISGDKDFNQLVSNHVHVLNPKGGDEYVLVTPSYIKKTFGFAPNRFIDYLALLGDSSDNVAGLEGCGKKTASELIQCNGTIEEIIAADEHFKFGRDGSKRPVSKKMEAKLKVSEKQLRLSKELVTIRTTDPADLEVEKPDFHALKAMFKTYGFKTYLARFNEFVAAFS